MSANRKSFKQTEEILIVDDELANLQLLTQLLSDAGYHVRPTRDPQLAIESALAQQPDLILLDVRMPEMDGHEVCRRLKEDEKTKDIPILFVSAIQDMQDKVRGFEAGAVDFISKPFQKAEIMARVRTHMDLRDMRLRLENRVEERTAELEAEIISHKRAKETQTQLSHDIGKRLKELRCMYAVSESVSEKDSLDEIFQDTVVAIPPGWHYPEITRGKLCYDNQEWVSEPFEVTQWKQSSDIIVSGQKRGSVEVYYLEECQSLDEGPFMVEERNLIDGIAQTLSETIERRQAEEERQESRALFDSYLSVAPVGMAILDTDARYANLNEELANFNGISINDHLGKRPSEILPGRLGKDSDDQIQRILRTNQPLINEEISGETLSQPGVTRYWLRSLFPIYGAHEEIKGIGAMVVDITDSKRVEEQLRQSQKMEALGTLAGGISHDINNMLYPILINANLLLEKCEADSEDRALLTDVIDSASKARDLVSQVLVFGRRGGNVEQICDFVSIATKAMKLVRAALPEFISIELNLSSSAVPVVCDPSQLYQVIVNLLTNAEQAISGSGEIKVSLDVVEIERFECFDGTSLAGRFARLAVIDNGAGIDDETLANIFDPFFTTKELGHGSGLGLSIIYGIVHSHGGGISVSSKPGNGTSFEIFLPIAEGTLDESRRTTIADSPDDTNAENILFVDDVESVRKSAGTCLERSGYSVMTVSSGKEALEIFLTDPGRFDLVMTDQAMPGMTGEELSVELLMHRPDIPIIICSGHSDVISPESSREKGIRAFLHKPATPRQLLRVVREVLDEANPGD